MIVFRPAGLDAEFAVLSWFRIAPCPVPDELAAKIPGAATATGREMGFDFTRRYSNCICVLAP
jgi:hypothetical protein